jgi:hypothetical protein
MRKFEFYISTLIGNDNSQISMSLFQKLTFPFKITITKLQHRERKRAPLAIIKILLLHVL